MRAPVYASVRCAVLLAAGVQGCADPQRLGGAGAHTTRTVEPDPLASAPAPAIPSTPAEPPAPAVLGLVREPDGTVHRPGPGACDPTSTLPACTRPNPHYDPCTTDEECSAGAHGRCIQGRSPDHPTVDFCACDYACSGDAECEPGQACVCGDGVPFDHAQCVAAGCRSDHECASGRCDLSVHANGCWVDVRLACRTAEDECRSDADCEAPTHCVFREGAGRWACLGMNCIVGRPLLVDGVARTAPAVERRDWSAALDLPRGLAPELSAALADHWAEVAALEHASIASFARFTLDLLGLGAAPELIVESQRAALDEVEHARLAWSLAGHWGGRRVGPGPLSLAAVPFIRELPAVIDALVREGCVGETIGAAEALILAERSAHPTLGPWLRAIGEDETRHAALAWRALRWLLEAHADDARIAAREALEAARAELFDAAPEEEEGPSAPEWGLLPRHELVALRREVFREIVEPVLEDMLSASAGPAGRACPTEGSTGRTGSGRRGDAVVLGCGEAVVR
ncbi:MAG: hypothetical protein R3B09_11020 [Nannocystaceae bacterium]